MAKTRSLFKGVELNGEREKVKDKNRPVLETVARSREIIGNAEKTKAQINFRFKRTST